MRTQQTLEALKDELQRNCGDRLAACRTVGVSLIFVNQWCKDDTKVAEELLEAERVGNQGLVSAAIQRAVHGVSEDVYYQGEVVGERKLYSDGLLTTLLKAKVPEFAKDAEGAGRGVTVNIANIMPRADNYEQWLAMKQATLAPPPEALPAPTEAVDAEYVDVDSPELVPAGAFKGIEL